MKTGRSQGTCYAHKSQEMQNSYRGEEWGQVGGPSQHAERVKGTLSVHVWWTHKIKH